MRVDILGSGYLGLKIAAFLSHVGYEVTCSTRSLVKLAKLQTAGYKTQLIPESIEDAQFLNSADILIISVAPSQQSDSYQKTYLQTCQQISKASLNLPNLKQIIYISSTSVYGDCHGQIVTEETTPQPLNHNTQILLAAEKEIQSIKSAKTTILRLGEIIGRGRRVIDRLKKMKENKFAGNGQNFTNLSPVNLILESIQAILENESAGIFNVCSSLHLKRKSLYNLICNFYNLPKVSFDPAMKPIHGGNKRVDSSKIYALMQQG